jgi:hypothetical protein
VFIAFIFSLVVIGGVYFLISADMGNLHCAGNMLTVAGIRLLTGRKYQGSSEDTESYFSAVHVSFLILSLSEITVYSFGIQGIAFVCGLCKIFRLYVSFCSDMTTRHIGPGNDSTGTGVSVIVPAGSEQKDSCKAGNNCFSAVHLVEVLLITGNMYMKLCSPTSGK